MPLGLTVAGIYTLGTQGHLPFENLTNTSQILPPSIQSRNFIHDSGDAQTAAADHDGIGAGCHCPGGIYSDEGSTNWNITQNVVRRTAAWLYGCRPGCAWIGPNWYRNNWFDSTSAASINVEWRCPLVNDIKVVTGSAWPAEADTVMREAGPRLKVDDASFFM